MEAEKPKRAVGVRLGPSAGGIMSLTLPPPAFRASSLREVLLLLVALGRVGYIPTKNPIGSLRNSVMAYPPSWIAVNYCEAGKSVGPTCEKVLLSMLRKAHSCRCASFPCVRRS